jgi:hypothetical protein
MTSEYFNKIVDARCTKIHNVLVEKAKEYATEDDRLHNFDRCANITGQSRERCLDGFMLKHYTSYRDILDNIDKGIIPSYELLNEKVTDLINYFILFEACVIEKINNEKENRKEESK